MRAQIKADRYYAVHVLGVLRDVGGVDILVPLLVDPDPLFRTVTIQALVKLRAKEALPYLRAMLADPALPKAGDQIRVSEVAINAILSLEKSQ